VSGSTVRQKLAAELRALLPGTWRFIPNQELPKTISKITAVLKLGRIEPLPEAPAGSTRSSVTLTVVSPHQSDIKAEIDLDDAITEVITALDEHAWIGWSLCEKVGVGVGVGEAPKYLGWDVTLTVITSKE